MKKLNQLGICIYVMALLLIAPQCWALDPLLPVPTTNLDSSTDSPASARSDLLELAARFNQQYKVHIGQFASFTAAVAAIGANPLTLVVNASTTTTGATAVPASLAVKVESPGLITSNHALTFSGGVFEAGNRPVFAGSGTVANLRESEPVWFGATGDGTTNDTAAFQKAQAASTTVIIRPPSVSYKVTNLAPVSGNKYVGIGLPAMLTGGTFGTFLIAAGSHDIVIDGIKFIGANYATPDTTGVEFSGASSYNITIKNCEFYNISNGIRVNGSATAPNYNCNFSKNLMYDVSQGFSINGLISSIVSENRILYKTYLFRGIQVTSSERCTYSNNVIIGNTATTMTGIIFQWVPALGYKQSNNNIVTGNIVQNIKEEAISLDNTTTNTVQYGTASSGSTTTLVKTAAGWTVNAYANYRVVIAKGTGAGSFRTIVSNTADTLAVGNYFNVAPDNTSEFIICAPFEGNQIIGNSVFNAGYIGISVWGNAIGNQIIGNVTRGTGAAYPAIRVLGYDYTTPGQRSMTMHNIIANNSVEMNGFVGINVGMYSDGTPGIYALGNQIIGNSITNHGIGILSDYASLGVIANNTLVNNSYGVRLTIATATDNTITGNKPISCGVPYYINQARGYAEIEVAAMPSTGTFAIGTFAVNIAPAVVGTGGYVTANQKYTLHGWRRITTGASNTINTDWVEVRTLTGG